MSRFAQIRSAIGARPLRGVVYVLVAAYAALAFDLSLLDALLVFAAVGLFDCLVLPRIRRRYQPAFPVVGDVEMEITTSPSGRTRKIYLGASLGFLALWLILLGHDAVTIIESYAQGAGDRERLMSFLLGVSLLTGYALTIGRRSRSSWHLIFTDRGVFQVFDTDRSQPSDRAPDEFNPPLVAQRYDWEQVVRFHWSRQGQDHVLHLHVRQPGITVPQLVSFPLPGVSQEDWQKLDQLLQTHVSAVSSAEPGGVMTASAGG